MAEANEKMVKVGGKEIAQSEIDKALALLEKQKEQRAKYAERNKQKTPEQVEKEKANYRRNAAKNRLLVKKAIAAGITVSEKEIDEYLATAK